MGVVGAVVGIVSGAAGVAGSSASASQTRAEQEAQAAIIGENIETEKLNIAEEMKRTAKEHEYQQSLSSAKAAAGGASGTSTNLYMEAMAQAGQEELDWMEKVGESRITAMEMEQASLLQASGSRFGGRLGGHLFPGLGGNPLIPEF